VEAVLIEQGDHWGPFGAKGVGEPPTISSTAAVAAAVRSATGRELTRVPMRPEDVAGV
jgi:CO/xanthine dehydrogenase Mo-binding subunit